MKRKIGEYDPIRKLRRIVDLIPLDNGYVHVVLEGDDFYNNWYVYKP